MCLVSALLFVTIDILVLTYYRLPYNDCKSNLLFVFNTDYMKLNEPLTSLKIYCRIENILYNILNELNQSSLLTDIMITHPRNFDPL